MIPERPAAALLRARWELRTLAGRSPWVARRLVRGSGNPISPETDIVIEGFARTGNTFAVTAFVMAQPGFVSVAHHVHLPAQVIAAERAGVPSLVLVREPEDTVLSLLVRLPHLTARQALRAYVSFYAPLESRRAAFVVAPFADVVTDFGRVIRRVNERFGTTFAEFDHTDANASRVLAEVDRSDRGAFPEAGALERGRARPTETRRAMKDSLRPAYRARELSRLRARAERLFDVFAAT